MIRSVMLNNILFISFLLITACGREVNISNNKLESYSNITQGESTKFNQEGVLMRGTPDTIMTQGGSFKVSTYSSIQVLEFIAARPLGAQIPVRYRQKEIKNNEIILELIQAK